ncbi:hypothetical protein [uncultured Ferrimonas sp.]|uniref:hypothetical protein n=1 Tax=uncultured Ferrimonas sp. TaxID=432640 RepID=UPI002615AA64|nr:hypothetical protein [uncultured Ferrimonas sp.]
MVNVNQAAVTQQPVVAKSATTREAQAQLSQHQQPHAEADKVTLSPQAQAIAKGEIEPEEGLLQDAKTFTYAALGMDHPQQMEQIDDDAYTAGQVVKAAATVVGVGLML